MIFKIMHCVFFYTIWEKKCFKEILIKKIIIDDGEYNDFKIERPVQFRTEYRLTNTLAYRLAMSRNKCVFLYSKSFSIRGPPVRLLKINIQKSKQEDKKLNYSPKKVFVLENGQYVEITFEELQRREKENKGYKDKYFLPLHGMLMEVTKEGYSIYYKERRREKYIVEREKKNGVFSYDALTTDEFNGEDILIDKEFDIEHIIELLIMVEKLKNAIESLTEDEKILIRQHFYEHKSQVELSRLNKVNQSNISRKLKRILAKLKKFLEN